MPSIIQQIMGEASADRSPPPSKDLHTNVLQAPLSTAEITGKSLAEQQYLRGTLGRAAQEGQQPYQDYTLAENAPTPGKMAKMEAAKFAKISPQSQEAEDIARLADPRNAANRARDESILAHVQGLSKDSINPRIANFERRMNQDPHAGAREYEGQNEDVIRAVERDFAKREAHDRAQIASNPIFNRPGTRYSGQKQRALRQFAETGKEQLTSILAKLRHDMKSEAGKSFRSQQEINANNLRALASVHGADVGQQLLGAQALQDIENQRRGSHYKHAGIKQAFGSKEETREQAIKDALHSQFVEARDWPRTLTRYMADIAHGLPTSSSISHQIQQNTPRIYTGMHGDLGNALYGMGSEMWGGRARHAHGDSITSEAMFNSMVDNTDPLATFNKMMRHQLMLGLMQRQQKRRKLKTGGEITPMPSFLQTSSLAPKPRAAKAAHASPIAEGAAMAQKVAAPKVDPYEEQYAKIMQRQLAESERLMQPAEEMPFMSRMARGFNRGLAMGRGPLSHLGHIGLAHFTDLEKEAKAASEKRKGAFELQKEVAKETDSMRHRKHQMLMEERRVRNEERRNTLDAMRLGHEKQPQIIEGHQIVRDKEGNVRAIPLEGFRKKKSAEEIKSRKAAELDLANAIKLKHQVGQAQKYNEKVETGPFLGKVNSILGDNIASWSGMGNVEDIENFKRSTGNIFLGAHQGLKNIPRSEEFAKRIDEVKGSHKHVKEANQASFEEIYDTADLSEKVAIETLLEMGMSEQEIADKAAKYASAYKKRETEATPTSAVSSVSTEQLRAERDALLAKAQGRGGD